MSTLPFFSSLNQTLTMVFECFLWCISHRDSVCTLCWELLSSDSFFSRAASEKADILSRLCRVKTGALGGREAAREKNNVVPDGSSTATSQRASRSPQWERPSKPRHTFSIQECCLCSLTSGVSAWVLWAGSCLAGLARGNTFRLQDQLPDHSWGAFKSVGISSTLHVNLVKLWKN